ncbi:hypothetical protein GGS23DRAFT_550835 [Durotheca rogersii]|uniref:uncharacterized protein n=1 Tax=Durotheca rogersii TaxID=419775 RepID=UPI00221F3056|nr:uncharacterized protein GGS23DRAFT_550835 [Durotheca rogersii]KAI5866475.1 hypothetical protein GGS23DRAFT_550835 [Durotheca rogersii]
MQPIDTIPASGHTIAVEFILALPKVRRSEIWALLGDGFDSIMSVSGQYDKRTMAAPGRSDWTAQQWGWPGREKESEVRIGNLIPYRSGRSNPIDRHPACTTAPPKHAIPTPTRLNDPSSNC